MQAVINCHEPGGKKSVHSLLVRMHRAKGRVISGDRKYGSQHLRSKISVQMLIYNLARTWFLVRKAQDLARI
jgi:hypothetical protein